ncbi:hypothetical protein IF129_25160 [Streptomyces chumphonensis]|uniref:Uncharacterized protein n=1 Tax=Streptomyces chumphonensis TaxID=1214925 RepID=A0A927F400_9ACTN|nr:hypothetical protein [Streptomyces chumphonensis]
MDTGQPRTEIEAAAEAAQLIAAAYSPAPHTPLATAYRDTTPVPVYGPTPPVHQPDRRVVPEWAAGIAVAGVGLGCFAALTGAGIYAATAGIAKLTIWGVAAIAVPFVGISAVAIAIGTAIRCVRAAAPPVTHHHYQGAVTQHHQNITTRGAIARTRINQ